MDDARRPPLPGSSIALSEENEKRQRGLIALVAAGGNAAEAHRELAKQGIHITERALRKWKTTRAEEYAEVRARIMPQVRAQMGEEHLALSRRLSRIENMLIGQLEAQSADLVPRDRINALRTLAINNGIHVDKMTRLMDGPEEAKPRMSFEEAVRGLAAKGLKIEHTVVAKPSEGAEAIEAKVVADGVADR